MGWSDDTDKLLADGTVVVVKNFTPVYTSTSVTPAITSTIIETATVLIFPRFGKFKKKIEGTLIINTHLLFFPATSSVAFNHRIFEPSETDYHWVIHVGSYEGHKEVYTEKVANR